MGTSTLGFNNSRLILPDHPEEMKAGERARYIHNLCVQINKSASPALLTSSVVGSSTKSSVS